MYMLTIRDIRIFFRTKPKYSYIYIFTLKSEKETIDKMQPLIYEDN